MSSRWARSLLTGDWRRSLEEGLTAGAAIDWLKDRNTELENIGVPGASDRKWVVDQLDALARLTGNGPKSSSIDIDGPGAADVPQEIDISFDEEVEETTTNSEIKIDEEPPAPDVQTIDIGAVPAQQLHAEESSSPSLATAAVVGAGAGFGMTIGAIAAMMLLRRRDAAGGRRELEPPRSGASVMVSGESTAVELAFSK